MNFDVHLTNLKYFVTICEHNNNMTSAAESLNVAQPSISKAIKDLEHDLGILLFERYKNRLLLTEDGATVLELTLSAFEKLEYYSQQINDIGAHYSKDVHIGIPPIFGTILIPQIYSSFETNLSDINIEIFEYTVTDALKYLDNNKIDIAVLLHKDIPVGYETRTLFETEIHFCINKTHALASMSRLSCKDIENIPLAILKSGSSHYSIVQEMFQANNVKPKIILQSNELLTITNLIQNYDVGTFTYKEIFKNNPDITSVPCCDLSNVKICAAWKKNRYLSRSAKKVIQYLLSLNY